MSSPPLRRIVKGGWFAEGIAGGVRKLQKFMVSQGETPRGQTSPAPCRGTGKAIDPLLMHGVAGLYATPSATSITISIHRDDVECLE